MTILLLTHFCLCSARRDLSSSEDWNCASNLVLRKGFSHEINYIDLFNLLLHSLFLKLSYLFFYDLMRLGSTYLQMSRDAIVIDLFNPLSRSFATSILKVTIIFRKRNTETLASFLPILFQVPESEVIHFLVLLISILRK